MNKQEYMKKLQERLESFGKELQEEIMEDYRQHFAEGENEGKSEEEIIEELGNIEEMIRELSEDELPEGFAQRTREAADVSEGNGKEVAETEENDDKFEETEMKRAFSYSGYYKAVVLEGKVADIYVTCATVLFVVTVLFYYKEEDFSFLSIKQNRTKTPDQKD